jgi:hypothetical protein
MMMVSSAFNAMDHAPRATVLSVIRSIALAVPLAWIGSRFVGLPGIYIGLVTASLVTAVLGLRWMRVFLDPQSAGHIEPSSALDVEAVFLDKVDQSLRAPLSELVAIISEKEHVSLRRVGGDAVGFFVKTRQLGHIHASGHLDLPLPLELGETLIVRGLVEHHRLHDSAGWFTHRFHDNCEVEQAKWLLRLAHAVYEIRQRGLGHEETQAELSSLGLEETCQAAIAQAASRWTPAA